MELAASRRRSTRYSNQAARPNNGQAVTRTSEHWRNWSTLRIRARDLPRGVTTNEIYKNFEQYGNIVHILILETGQGGRSSVAEVNFEPIPAYDFWSQRRISFRRYGANTEYAPVSNVSVELDKYQKKKQPVSSPVNDNVQYPEKLEVPGNGLDFGILSGPTSMTVMYTCAQASKLLLNLKRKEIEVHFTFIHKGTSSSKPRSFRFLVALDEQFNIWQLFENLFVISLSKPPPYTKMLSESRDGSHSADGRAWSVEDMWARQADICAETVTYRSLESMPITLEKQLNTINVARWTTFCFHTSNTPQALEATKTFVAALKDWNIPVQTASDFEISQAPPVLGSNCWSVINGTHDHDLTSSFLQDLSRAEMEFSVRYQLEVCLSHGWISEYSITQQFLEQLAQWPPRKATQALVYVATNAKRLYDPMNLFTDLQYSKPLRARRLPDNCIEVYSATVTATGLLFHTPSVEISNRIIRKYKSKAHRFLRVRFEDDDYRGHTRLFPSLNNKMVTIFKRVKRALKNGIKLGDIKYEFLAWGNSQLREHGVWFVAPTSDMTAERIRDEMGSFKETVVAKKAARMGQCFSTTQPVHLQVPPVTDETVIPDIQRGRFIFSDGVGKISPLAAQLVTSQLSIKGPVPSVFQFRLGGCKGVLAVANDLSGINFQIRKSQFKFNSHSGDLEIIRWAQFWQPFLNRQIILCLSHLGVPTTVFLRMQDEAVHAINKAMTDETTALTALRTNVDPNQMTLSLCELVEAGFSAANEPFTVALLHLWRAWSLKYLKEKAKIPVSQGAFVLGCVDETATLKGHTLECPSGEQAKIEEDPSYMEKLPEIFIQITDVPTGKTKVVEGLCILARNPSLYPGDIRVVVARDVPALRHMVDVVVMPQTGERDLPSMCSGGDLDGDDYIVIWDPNLIPQIWNTEPFHYEAPEPKTVSSEITATHLIEFFHDYLRYDALGRIATAHLAAADLLDDGLDSSVCQELAELHSQAVDYPKTGRPAIMRRKLERDRWPHFMEKTTKRMYHSHKVLGKLYDSVQKVQFKPKYDNEFDSRILGSYDPPADLIERLRVIKMDYDSSLRRILTQHGIGTEFELWSTFVLHHSKASKDYKFHEEVGSMSKVLKDQFYEVLTELADGKDFDHLAPVAVAAYKLTSIEVEEAKTKAGDEGEIQMPFISFPWVLQDTLIKIAIQADKFKKKAVPEFATESMPEASIDQDMVTQKFQVSGIATADTASREEQKVNEPLVHAGLPNEASAKLFTDIEESSDTYGPDLGSTSLESSSNNESAIVTPVSHREISSPCFIQNEIQKEDTTAVPTTAIHSDYEETLIDGFEPIKHDVHFMQLEESSANMQSASHLLVENIQPSAETEAKVLCAEYQADKQWAEFLDSREALAANRSTKTSDKTLVCQLWRDGQCRNSAETCHFTHNENGSHSALLQTCWFWKSRGTCSRGDQCSFAHWDTGMCAIPPASFSYSASRRDPRSSPSKQRRRKPLAQVVLSDSDSDMDPVPQARRFLKKSPTKRKTQVDTDDEEASGSGAAVVQRSGSPTQPVATLAVNQTILKDTSSTFEAKTPSCAHLVDQESQEPERSTLTKFAIISLPQETSLPLPMKTEAKILLPIEDLRHTTDLKTPVSVDRAKTAQSNDLLTEGSNTQQPQTVVNKPNIPLWNATDRPGHIVNVHHKSGQVQRSRLVLDDPAEHEDDSDYEVDEIFD